jgi:hypothetical protein
MVHLRESIVRRFVCGRRWIQENILARQSERELLMPVCGCSNKRRLGARGERDGSREALMPKNCLLSEAVARRNTMHDTTTPFPNFAPYAVAHDVLWAQTTMLSTTSYG